MDYVRSRLDKPTFSKLMSEGESLSLAQTIEIALPPLQYLMSLPEEPRQAAPEPAAQKSLGETPPADLTEREIEVLRLLVSGKSNPQIAAELYLSINTVQAHLRSVYSKIGVASRAEATRYALEHNLAG